MADEKNSSNAAVDEQDVVVADGDFFDWCFNMEREVLEEIGDEEALAINARDHAALHEAETK